MRSGVYSLWSRAHRPSAFALCSSFARGTAPGPRAVSETPARRAVLADGQQKRASCASAPPAGQRGVVPHSPLRHLPAARASPAPAMRGCPLPDLSRTMRTALPSVQQMTTAPFPAKKCRRARWPSFRFGSSWREPKRKDKPKGAREVDSGRSNKS